MAKQLSNQILEYLSKNEQTNSLDLSTKLGQPHDLVIGAIKSLQTFDHLIAVKPAVKKIWEIVPEGQHIIKYGSHEAVVYNAVPDKGIPQKKLLKSSPYAKLGFSKAMAAGWIKLDNSSGTSIVQKNVPFIVDTVCANLKDIENIPEKLKIEYKKRNLLREVQISMFDVEKGLNFSTEVERLEADLTSDLLAHGAWKTKKFKPYNFDALGAALQIGHLHPLLKVRHEFRKIFLEMGFTEMPANNYVESSFWNFDALFQPQQHPARDAHDTFFVSEPRICTELPTDYLERVKTVHSKGGYGSQGYRYNWKLEEAQKNLLRTHTTANSARMLYKLIQEGEFKPVKYFSIDKVFRNETLDATHLAEFHQIEGVIADYGLTLGDLIGTLYEFFKKLGITQLRFKPAYNPYTEPSMEIFCYHNGLEKWIEIGNSGMFRPELLLPINVPPDVNVLGWGLSLERPTMIKYGISNIRDLVGPKVDMEMVHNNPICRLEKTSRRAFVLQRKAQDQEERSVKSHSNQGEKIEQPIVYSLEKQALSRQGYIIFCDPEHPIYFLEYFLRFIKPYLRISVSTYVHSTVRDLPKKLAGFCSDFSNMNTDKNKHITLIWKTVGIDPIMELPGMRKIAGIVNIARYLNRLVELNGIKVLVYEQNGPSYANNIDSYLDRIHCALHGVGNNILHTVCKTTPYALGQCISIVDIILESIDKYNIKK